MIKKGMTLDQVKAAGRPRTTTPRYGATTGSWTTDMFVEAVYDSLGGGKKPAAAAPRAPGREVMRNRSVRVQLDLIAVVVILAVALISRSKAGSGGAPPTARAAAPIDLTGTWVSVVTEDWRWRMRTPPKGDYASLPLNDAATQSRRYLGSGAGHGRRRAVPRLRRRPRSCACRAACASRGTATPR